MDERLLNTAREFNAAMRFLNRVYVSRKKGTFEEEKVLRNTRRLHLVMNTEPLWMIEVCGPFFLKYGDLISQRKWDKFIDHDFTEEKEKYKNSEDGSAHSYDAMDGKIKFIKKAFLEAEDEEREAMGDAVQTILSSYCKYVLIVKERDEKEKKNNTN